MKRATLLNVAGILGSVTGAAPPSGDTIIGHNVVEPNGIHPNPGYKVAQPATVTAAGTIAQMEWYLSGLASGGSGTQQFKGFVYSDVSGQPNTLLGESTNTVTIAAGDAAAWKAFTIPPINVTEGQVVWIGILINTGNCALHFYKNTPLGLWDADDWPDPSTTWAAFNGDVTYSARATVSAPTSAYRAAILADSPSSYWRLGETSGTTAVDEKGVANGTYSGAMTLGTSGLITGDSDKAVTLTGGSISLPAPTAWAGAGTSFTIEMWVNISSYSIDLFTVGDTTNGFKIRIYGTGNTNLISYNGGTSVSTGNGVLNTGTKGLATAVKSGSTWALYVNGVHKTSDATNNVTIPSAPILIGTSMRGIVDEVAVYNSALTSSQILAHYNAGA